MIEKNSFGSILKRLREEKQKKRIEKGLWTKTAVARRIGVSRPAYYAWENDESLPDTDNLKRIIAVFRPGEEDDDALYRSVAQTPPPIHNLPVTPYSYFTGREAYLDQLGQSFESGKKFVFLCGPRGIGKTEIALMYARRCHPHTYRAVFWIDASHRDTFQASYDAVADLLELPERSDAEAYRRVQAVNRWLETHTRWLMIMDNLSDLKLLFLFSPAAPLSHTIVTTRLKIIADNDTAAEISIGAMEPEEGLLFLLRTSGALSSGDTLDAAALETEEAARQAAKLLKGHPSGILSTGAYLGISGVSITEYMQFISNQSDLLQEVGLDSLHPLERAELLIYIYDQLITHTGNRIVERLTDQQVYEFVRICDAKNDVAAFLWLEATYPGYPEIVAEEYAKIKSEIIQAAPRILASLRESTDGPPE